MASWRRRIPLAFLEGLSPFPNEGRLAPIVNAHSRQDYRLLLVGVAEGGMGRTAGGKGGAMGWFELITLILTNALSVGRPVRGRDKAW